MQFGCNYFHRPAEAEDTKTCGFALVFLAHGDGEHKPALPLPMLHPLLKQGERPAAGVTLGPGALLSESDEERLLGLMLDRDDQRERSEWIEPQVVAQSSAGMAWFVPGSRRVMHVRQHDGNRRQRQGYRPETLIWPSLVLVATPGRIAVCATKGKRRPRQDDRAYHAPLGNVYENGSVCLGSAQVPGRAAADDMEGFERAIFDTAFNHFNHDHAWRGQKTRQLDRAYFEAVGSGKRMFPARLLVPMSGFGSVGAFVSAHLRRTHTHG